MLGETGKRYGIREFLIKVQFLFHKFTSYGLGKNCPLHNGFFDTVGKSYQQSEPLHNLISIGFQNCKRNNSIDTL